MIQAPITNYGYTQPMYMPQQAPAEYSAIKINIIDPKVQTPGAQQGGVYNYPQSSVYGAPQMQPAPMYMPYPNVPQQPMVMPPVQQPVQQIPMQPVPIPQPVQVPQPQVTNTQINNVPPSVVTPQTQTVPVQQAPPTAQTPQVNQAPTLDVPGFAAAIKSDDLQKVGDVIEQVADIAQKQPDLAPQLLDTELMESLLQVIGKDITTLQGPSEQQKDLRQQIFAGKQLSEADLQIANEITPQEMAERNKQYALFTTAIIQDALIKEFQKTNNMTPDIKDLPGMEQIVSTIKDNPNPMLRASGLAALAYNARPEYKAVMKEVFELSKQDIDENVQKVAADGLAKLETI